MRRLLVLAMTLGFIVFQTSLDLKAQDLVEPEFDGAMGARVLWQDRYDGPMSSIDRVASIALHPDNSIVYVTGESHGFGFNFDYITLAYDALTGDVLWHAFYDPPWSRNDLATHVLVSPDGSMVFVTGTSIGSGYSGDPAVGLGDADWDFLTLAYDSQTGVQLWESRFHGHQRDSGWTNAMAIAPNGSALLINGRSNCADDASTSEAEPGNATIAYDPITGDELWVACFDGCLSYEDYGTQLAVSEDGSTAIVVGTHRNGETGYDFATIALDMQTGEQRWIRYYDNGLHDPDAFLQEPIAPGADPTFDSPRAVALAPNGHAVYVTGESRGHYGLVDYATVAYDISGGNQKGVIRFDGALQARDRVSGIAVSPTGDRVFVTGGSQTGDAGRDVVTIAYDWALREELWVARYNSGATQDDYGREIRVSADGQSLIVRSDSWGANSLDWIVTGYDAATGEQRWIGLYDGETSHADFARGVVINDDASAIFVTGHSCGCGTSGFNILTMAIGISAVEPLNAPVPWTTPRSNGRRVRGAAFQR